MSTVAAALLAGSFALVGALLASRYERKRWLRDARFRAYSVFLQRLEIAFYARHDPTATSWDDTMDALMEPYGQMLLLGTSRVIEAADALVEMVPLPGEEPPAPAAWHDKHSVFLARAIVALHARGAASSKWMMKG